MMVSPTVREAEKELGVGLRDDRDSIDISYTRSTLNEEVACHLN